MKIRRFTGKIYWNAEYIYKVTRAIFEPSKNIFRIDSDSPQDEESDQIDLISKDGFNFTLPNNTNRYSVNLRLYDTGEKLCLAGFYINDGKYLCVIELEEVDEFKD